MVKAMLNSPVADNGNYASCFQNSHFSGLARKDEKLMPAVRQANDLILQADRFISAYGRLSELEKLKCLSTLEVRAVNHALGLSFPSRANFSSLPHIGKAFWDECKAIDKLLPVWSLVNGLDSPQKAAAPQSLTGALRKIPKDGVVSNAEMYNKGFQIGVSIYLDNDPDHLLKVVELHNNNLEIVCHKYKKGEPLGDLEANKVTLSRIAVLSNYKIHKEVKIEFLTCHSDPSDSMELKISALQGVIKHNLIMDFQKSSEKHCVLQMAPSLKVFAQKAFKAGALKLTPMTTMVIVAKQLEKGGSNHYIGDFDAEYKIFLKSSNNMSSKTSSQASELKSSLFVSKFFCVRSSHDQNIVNCELQTKDVEVFVGPKKFQLAMPYLTNTKPVSDEVELVCLSSHTEQVQKKPRISDADAAPKAAPKGKGGKGGKGKNKGKAKANSK